MVKIIKKLFAVILTAIIIITASACNLYNENNLWAAKKGDYSVPIGGYVYYLRSSLAQAAEKIGTDTEVLKGTIDGEKAEAWIKNEAKEDIKQYIFINEKLKELGIELTEEDLETIESNTDFMWGYYGTNYETYGISRESFNAVYSDYSTKYGKVFEAVYGEGGEMEVSDDDLIQFYNENYYYYSAITLPATTTNEEGESEAIDDDAKSALTADLEEMKSKITEGASMESIAAEYTASKVELTDQTIYSTNSGNIEDASSTVQQAVIELAEGDVSDVIDDGSSLIIVKRLPVSEISAEKIADEDERNTVLSKMKNEDFQEYVETKGKEVTDIEFNESAMNTVSISNFITDENKMGTSSLPEESSDVSDESSSEDESSDESSAETE